MRIDFHPEDDKKEEANIPLPRAYADALNLQPLGFTEFFQLATVDFPGVVRVLQLELGPALGRGSQGTVYSAKQPCGRTVAVKRFRSTHSSTSIWRELRILLNLQGCPNIIQVLGAVRPEERITHVLFEYVPTLSAEPIVSVSQVGYIVRQLLTALRSCHSRGILHRDIKPSNLLIEKDSLHVKLIDFGHAQFFLPNHRYPSDTGTVGYRAPELLFGQPYIHYAIDIWAAGCVLLELLLPHVSLLWRSQNNFEQISKLNDRFGTASLRELCSRYELRQYSFTDVQPARTWIQLMEYHHMRRDPSREALCLSSGALDLVNRMLEIDPQKRLTVDEALQHSFLL